jgi:hypothetical protein
MSANTPPATSRFPVLWRGTQAGRAEKCIQDGMRQRREMRLGWPRLTTDFPGAVEAIGHKKAAQMMREEGN